MGKQPRKQKKKNTASVRKNISKGCDQETEKKNHKVFFQSKSSRYYLPLKERASFTALKTYFTRIYAHPKKDKREKTLLGRESIFIESTHPNCIHPFAF